MSATSQNKSLFEDYDGFVEKFKPKKTTDDCYTPPIVYDAVARWVSDQYGVDRANFMRPFYPGGDFEKEDYSGKIVVDNPPFSIISKIARFFLANEIPFFLFAPTLSTVVRLSDYCTALVVGADVTYENGAEITTSFITNMEPHDIRMRTAPTLYEAVKKANEEDRREVKKTVPKYSYPIELVTAAAIYPYNKYGINYIIPRSESVRVSALDAQRHLKKTIFGSGLLISNRLKTEREKAEREKTERFALSDREMELIEFLSR